ncbi:hypothetical protein C474_19334 [Halogeometricum pallidum JCM 14848]|uniref:Uncharacterized protein n=1 Tax=Halogeometricum pallidum JCM 14848 TaxID=1227487 RepID=M0CXI3_HALPD|nr:hypothetical protein C474_19334 [Halogeometricum pallidum JCM 14848]
MLPYLRRGASGLSIGWNATVLSPGTESAVETPFSAAFRYQYGSDHGARGESGGPEKELSGDENRVPERSESNEREQARQEE